MWNEGKNAAWFEAPRFPSGRERFMLCLLQSPLSRSVMKSYMISLAAVTALLLSAPGFSQDKDPVSSAVKEILPRMQSNMTAAAEEMPADKFSFQPSPQQISFGHLIMHIAQVNDFLCSKIGDQPAPATPDLKETDSKDKLVSALKDSFAFCSAAVNGLTDARLGDSVELRGGRKASRAFAVITLSNDWADHYGTEAAYLRQNGLLPPTAK
jgi:hypothetical protein